MYKERRNAWITSYGIDYNDPAHPVSLKLKLLQNISVEDDVLATMTIEDAERHIDNLTKMIRQYKARGGNPDAATEPDTQVRQ